jgi:subtilase family serine protease
MSSTSTKTASLVIAGLSLAGMAFSQTEIRSTVNEYGYHYHYRALRPAAGVDTSTPPSTAITPSQMLSIYGFNLVANQGAGQTIALIDWYDDPTIEADLGVFDTQYSLPACTTANGCFKKVYSTGTKPGTGGGSSDLEISLDVEWAHAIAPAAKIILVEAPSGETSALLKAVVVAEKNGAKIISMSFGGSESSSETGWDQYFALAGATYVASSGDSGHGSQWPASSPKVIGVGGTTLTQSNGVWESEVAWSGSGGGLSSYESEPSYQSAFQNQGKRGIPDLAYDADPNTGVAIYCGTESEGIKGWVQIGGTSMGAPEIAGMIAIVNSSRVALSKGALSFPTDVYSFTGDFHDITSGTNGSCGSLCDAGPGYDFVTGVGTPIANSLIPALVGLP